MPELPEVAALVGLLREDLVGRTVERVDVVSIAALKTVDPPVSALVGGVVAGVERYGKQLDVVVASDDEPLHVVVHLARAGWVRVRHDPDGGRAPASAAASGRGPIALRLILTGGTTAVVTDAAKQKKVAVSVVREPLDVPGVARLGPDPLDPSFDATAFDAVLGAHARTQLKGLLRDQSVIAGIGNAYSDEILHAAGLSPFALAGSLDVDGRARLFAALREVLDAAVEAAAHRSYADLKDGKRQDLRVHGRTGEACPVCGDTVREVRFRDSSLQYCPTCQTGGTVLKDRSTSRFLK